MCGLSCADGDVMHLGVHSLNVDFVGVVDPFLGGLSDFVLYLPLGGLGFTACGNFLNVCHDIVHGRCLTVVCGWALGSIVAWLVTFETGNRCRVADISTVILWGRV